MSIMPTFSTRTNNYHNPSSLEAWDPFNDNHCEGAMVSKHTSSHHVPYSYSHDQHPQHAPHSYNSHQHRETTSLANARVEWKETPEAYFIRVEIPGVMRENLRVLVEDDKLLKISGERQTEKEDKNDNWHLVEGCRGKFVTAFMLPEDSSADQVKSTLANGMLTVTVPKRQLVKHHVRPVETTYICT